MSDRAPQQQTSATPVSTPAQPHALPTQTLDTADSAYLDYSAPIQAKIRPFRPQPVDSPFAKSSDPLAPRPFIIPNPAHATHPNLQAQLKHAEKFGYNLVPPHPTRQDAPHTSIANNQPIQTKLTVGTVGDRYEQEADRVADQVMSMPDAAIQQPVQREAMPEEDELQTKPLAAAITPLVQREAMPEEEEVQTKAIGTLQREEVPEEEELQMKPIGMLQREEAMPEEEAVQPKPLGNSIQREAMPEEEELQAKPLGNGMLQREAMPEEEEAVQAKGAPDAALPAGSNLESRLSSSQGSGSPLPNDVRSFMEPRFGADFSQVRVHTGNEAVQMNQDLNAQAFTHKQDVYFGAGKAPGKDTLTAHELTHVVQQTSEIQRKCSICENEKKIQREPQLVSPLIELSELPRRIQRQASSTRSYPAPAPGMARPSPPVPRCLVSPECSGKIPGSSSDFAGDMNKEEEKNSQTAGPKTVAFEVMDFANKEQPGLLQGILLVLINPALPKSVAAQMVPDYTIPEKPSFNIEVPEASENDARTYNKTKDTKIGNYERAFWRALFIATLTHEVAHSKFEKAPPTGITATDEVSMFNLGELNSILSEFPIIYRAVMESTKERKVETLQAWIRRQINSPEEGIRGILKHLKCINPCSIVNSSVKSVFISQSANWTQPEKDMMIAELTSSSNNLDWPQ